MPRAAPIIFITLTALLLTGCHSSHGSPREAPGRGGVPTKSWDEVSAEAAADSGLYDEPRLVGTRRTTAATARASTRSTPKASCSPPST
jgi:hypothetical protein